MTVRELAKLAGVSSTTVSLVLNKKDPHISPETREKILAIAKEHNYRPNRLAQSLATNKTKTLGVIVPELANLFYPAMVTGIESYAQRQGYSLLLCNCSDSVTKLIQCIRTLDDRCVDGMFIIPPAHINEGENHVRVKKVLDDLTRPYILLERAVEDVFHDFVVSDNKQGGYIATRHLIELGHKKIGCITGPLSEYGAMRRMLGYREALEDAGLPFDDSLVVEGDFRVQSGRDGAQELIAKGVTALFCGNDMMAQGAMYMAEELGVPVPRQLSIVGYDNNPIGELLRVPLTTVAQPVELMGRNACEILLSKIKTPSEKHQDYYFSPSLICRGSTAKV